MINVTPFLTFGLSIIHFKEGFLYMYLCLFLVWKLKSAFVEQKQSWAGGEFIADQPWGASDMLVVTWCFWKRVMENWRKYRPPPQLYIRSNSVKLAKNPQKNEIILTKVNRVFSRHQCCSGWRAHRLDVVIIQSYSFLSQFVNIWGLNFRTMEAYITPSKIIHQNK